MKLPVSQLFAQQFVQAQIKENMTGGFPSQRASNAEMFPFDDAIMILDKHVVVYNGIHIAINTHTSKLMA